MNLQQSRTTSLTESALNTASGFALSLGCQYAFLVLVMGLPMTWTQNLAFALIMTAVSIGRGYLWRRYFEARRMSFALSPFLLAVIAERRRQVEVEGYGEDHDREHVGGELARAGAAYLYAGSLPGDADMRRQWLADVRVRGVLERLWPWTPDFWKPRFEDRRRDLVRGCALGLAEGERMERARRR